MITKNHIPLSRQKRIGLPINPTSITIHSTGNDKSTAENERGWLTNPENTRYASYHYVVGDDVIIECIPPTEVAYHCGNEQGNFNSIGIEMVETGDRKKVIENTVKLVSYLQGRFNIPHDGVLRHFDWKQTTSKGGVWYKECPRILRGNNWKGWVDFKNQLVLHDEPSGWAIDSWTKATELGVVDGKRPKEPMTREEVIVVLDRLGVLI